MEAMEYESIIRRAFGLKEGKIIERFDDPASLANTDVFTEDNLSSVKAGVSYAFEIFNNEIFDNFNLGEIEHERIEQFTSNVIAAKSIIEVSKLIHDFNETVEGKYFEYSDGIISLKL